MRLADDDELQIYIEIKDDEPATPEERFLKIVCTELARYRKFIRESGEWLGHRSGKDYVYEAHDLLGKLPSPPDVD